MLIAVRMLVHLGFPVRVSDDFLHVTRDEHHAFFDCSDCADAPLAMQVFKFFWSLVHHPAMVTANARSVGTAWFQHTEHGMAVLSLQGEGHCSMLSQP